VLVKLVKVSVFGWQLTSLRIAYIGTDYFYIDDGSALQGDGGRIGVEVYCPGLTKPTSGKTGAIVRGICTIEMEDFTPRPCLRPHK